MAITGGHKTEAARTLGVSRPRLDRLLAKHGLN
jgi:DNA-binding protein Fis